MIQLQMLQLFWRQQRRPWLSLITSPYEMPSFFTNPYHFGHLTRKQSTQKDKMINLDLLMAIPVLQADKTTFEVQPLGRDDQQNIRDSIRTSTTVGSTQKAYRWFAGKHQQTAVNLEFHFHRSSTSRSSPCRYPMEQKPDNGKSQESINLKPQSE